ncbi:hypothetical protein D3C80_652550 [compost metagenome]
MDICHLPLPACDQLFRLFLFTKDFAEPDHIVVEQIHTGPRPMIVDVDAAFTQHQRFDIEFCQRLRGHFPTKTIIPAGEEQVWTGSEKVFDRRVFGGQFRNGSLLLCEFRDVFVPAGDPCHADDRRLELQGKGHLRHIDILNNGTLWRAFKGQGLAAVVHRNRETRGPGACRGECQ